MSVLMAEMYNLGLARQEASSMFDDLSDLETEDGIIEFQEKQNKAKKNKQLAEIHGHLDKVLGRVGKLLTEVGISPELPQPELDREEKWGKAAFAFRPPSHYLEDDEEDGPNAEAKARMQCLMNAFASTADYRDQLLMEIIEWFANSEMSVGEQAQDLHEAKVVKRDKEEAASMELIMDAMENANEALRRLQKIGVAMFDDKDATQAYGAKGISGATAARLNAKVRRTSMKLDQIPTPGRASAMKSIFVPQNLPDDLQSLQANIDEEDEEEQKLLDDLSQSWQDVCEEVRDTIIGVHELKIIKRSTKLAVRRVLYLFKLIAALLGRRTDELKTKDTNLIKMRAESSAYKSKMEHLHKESKNWREKLTAAQAKNGQLGQDLAALESEVTALNSALSAKEGIIADLSEQISAAETQKKTVPSPVDDFDSLGEGAKRKINEMKARSQMQEQRIDEMEEVLGELATSLEQEKAAGAEEHEKNVVLEAELNETKAMLKVAEMRAENFEEILDEKSEKISALQNELDTTRTELQAKEALVSKLTTVTVDEVDDPSAFLKRRGSIRRRNSVRRGSKPLITPKKSTAALNADESASDLHAKDGDDGVGKTQLLAKPSIEVSIQISSTRLQIKRSKSRLALPTLPDVYEPAETAPPAPSPQLSVVPEIPAIEILPSCDSSPQVSPEPERPRHQQRRFTISAALMDRRSANVVSNKEYKRVVAELRETQRARDELQNEIDDLNKELEEQEDRFERMHLNAEKQHKLKMLLEEDKLKSGTGKLYSEYLKVEVMLRRFKFDLSGTLEKALMGAAAKQAKNSYRYHAPANPKDFVDSARITNEMFEGAFGMMMEAVRTSVKTMQLSQRRMRRVMEEELGHMTVHHLKVLADKSRRIEDLQNKADRYKEEMEEHKLRHQNTAKENIQLLYEVAEAEKMKRKVAMQLQDYENERMRNTKPRSPFSVSTDGKPHNRESLEGLLHYAKEQQTKLKRRLAETEQMLEKERANRARLENALISRQGTAQRRYDNGALAVKREPKDAVDQSVKESGVASSTTQRYVKTLRQIEEAASTSKKRLIDKGLLGRVKQVTRRWNACVTLRWVYVMKRYVKLASYKAVLENVAKEVIACGDSGQAGDLQACFWHVVRKKRLAVENKAFANEVESLVQQCRHQVIAVFRQVGFAVISLKKSGKLTPKTAQAEPNEEHPIPPSNSALSPTSSVSSFTEEEEEEGPAQNEKSGGEERDETHGSPPPVQQQLKENRDLGRSMSVNSRSAILNAKQSTLRSSTVTTEHSTTTTYEGSGAQTTDTPDSELKSDESGCSQSADDDRQVSPSRDVSAPFVPEHVAVSEEAAFSRRFFGRRLSTSCCDRRSRRCDTAPERSDATQWNRRASLPHSPPKRCPTSQSRRRAARNDNVICDVPRTMEMDIRQDLNRARKHLQQAMRRYSVAPGSTPADLTLLDKQTLKKLRDRRRTMAFLGVDKDGGPIPRYDTSDLIDIYKSQGVAEQRNPPSAASSDSSFAGGANETNLVCGTQKCAHYKLTTQRCCGKRGSSEASLGHSGSRGLPTESRKSFGADRGTDSKVSLQDLNQQAVEPDERRSRFNETVSRRSSTH